MEEAANWLIEQEQRTEAAPQSMQRHAAFSTQSAGVAGILRREEQLAATTDRHVHGSKFWNEAL